jgi:hypothetical protein
VPDVTSQEWISILKRAAASQSPEAEGSLHRDTVAKGMQYGTAIQSEMDASTSPLTISQIVDISMTKLKEIREKYLRDEIKEIDYINLTSDIVDPTLQLIAAWEAKKNHSVKEVLRRIALVASALLSLVLIGIPFFFILRKQERAFKAEIDRLKQAIFQANEVNSQAMVLKKLSNIPAILEEIKKRYTDHRRQELINDQLVADWEDYEKVPVESRPPYDEEFERDIKKGACFRRIDRVLNIEDQVPIPSPRLEGSQRVQQALSSLQALLKQPEDRRWAEVLQVAVTHASLLTAFLAALSAINIDVASVQWEANGQYYSIKATFSNQSFPVILEIIRHPKTGNIEKVNVTVKGSMDIVRYHTMGDENPQIIIPGAITEELKYSIAFGQNNRPVISDLHSQMKANFYIPEEQLKGAHLT